MLLSKAFYDVDTRDCKEHVRSKNLSEITVQTYLILNGYSSTFCLFHSHDVDDNHTFLHA